MRFRESSEFAIMAATALFTIASAVIGLPLRLASQQLPSARTITVYDSLTGQPLAGVRVRDSSTGQLVVTSSAGTADLGFLLFRGPSATVELLKLGFASTTVAIQRNDTARIAFRLSRISRLPTCGHSPVRS